MDKWYDAIAGKVSAPKALYRVPAMTNPGFAKMFINRGSRTSFAEKGVPLDQVFISYLDDMETYLKQSGLNVAGQAIVVIVDRDGKLLYKDSGPVTNDKTNSLIEFMTKQ